LLSWLHLKFVPKFKHFQILDSTSSLLHFGFIIIYYCKTKVLCLSWLLNPIANDGFQVSKLVFIIVYFKDLWWGRNLESHDAKNQLWESQLFILKFGVLWNNWGILQIFRFVVQVLFALLMESCIIFTFSWSIWHLRSIAFNWVLMCVHRFFNCD